ncbi:acetyltransferase [Verticillium dahliae]|nr:acetyltransferase [Verticillium dahliae]
MTSSVPAQTFSEVPDGILDLLILHLPYSLSLVRRLQYTAASPTGKTPSARIVVASDSPPAEPTRHDAGFDVTARHFTVSYFDPSRGPETQTWIYSTLEDAHARDSSVVLAQDETAHCEKQIMAVVSEVKRIAREYDAVEPLAFPRQVIVGTLHHAVRAVMRKHDVSLTHRHDYQKIIFPFDKLPSADAALPAGLSFETTTLEDCHIVKSRTDIPRKVTTLFTLPSITIKQADGTPVAWAFLGPDGSMCSLHCEEQHRRKGLARAVAAKVMRERTRLFGSEPWSSSEVAPTNVSSHAMCKSLNGEIKWDVSWTLLGIEENGS